VPALTPQWLTEAYDGSVEVRLAASLASLSHNKLGPIRRHVAPIDPKTWNSPYPGWAETADDPNVVWGGGGLVPNLIAVLQRRIMEVLRLGKQKEDVELVTPLAGRCSASLGDLAAFIGGSLRLRRENSRCTSACTLPL